LRGEKEWERGQGEREICPIAYDNIGESIGILEILWYNQHIKDLEMVIFWYLL
jgi:hypothetical protein